MRYFSSYWIYLFLILLCNTFLTTDVVGQSPYEFSLKRELPILATGLGAGGIGGYLLLQTDGLTSNQINQLDPFAINQWDRNVIGNNSVMAKNVSDVIFYGSHTLPLTLLAGQRVRADRWRAPLVWLEGYIVNAGLTGLLKYTTKRPRPYVFNINESLELRESRDARTSFVSGHTSVTAYNAFFTAQAFADYYPKSRAKPLVWIGAIVIPAVTGFLRVKAGRHYPTDVIAGYALGAATGILLPRLHRRKQQKKQKRMD